MEEAEERGRAASDNDDNDSPVIVMELIEHAVALNRWANDHGLDALARIYPPPAEKPVTKFKLERR